MAPTAEDLPALVKRFQYTRVLNSNPRFKVISLLGTIDRRDAILTVEKTHFMFEENIVSQQQRPSVLEAETSASVATSCPAAAARAHSPLPLAYDTSSRYSCVSGLETVKQVTANDIYYWGVALIREDIDQNPTARINLIWPATAVHVRKYDQESLHLVRETPQLYLTIVKPYIDEQCTGGKYDWVYRILYEGEEEDRIVYKEDEDKQNGFLVLPDTRWDGVNVDSMYLVAIAYRDDIKSLRDLKPQHLPWLRELNRKIRSVVPGCYNYAVKADELRIFIHYQPSYYHFHLHIVNIRHPGEQEGIMVGKAVLLEDTIETLAHIGPGGYMERSLTYSISDRHELWRRGLGHASDQQYHDEGVPPAPVGVSPMGQEQQQQQQQDIQEQEQEQEQSHHHHNHGGADGSPLKSSFTF